MKNKETWRVILQIIASIVSAALTALGTTSCMVNRNLLISSRPQSPHKRLRTYFCKLFIISKTTCIIITKMSYLCNKVPK